MNARDHGNQIEAEGEVDHEEANQSPIPPALDRGSAAGDLAVTRRRHGGFRAERGRLRAYERKKREMSERGAVGLGFDPSQTGPSGPSWSNLTSWAQPIV
jgi:hypothetical protein